MNIVEVKYKRQTCQRRLVAVVIRQALYNQLPFQDPKMEVLYHIKAYLGDISPYIALT